MKFYQIQYRNMPGYEIESFSTNLSPKAKSTLKKSVKHGRLLQNPILIPLHKENLKIIK